MPAEGLQLFAVYLNAGLYLMCLQVSLHMVSLEWVGFVARIQRRFGYVFLST
jgi:hypothetical protein